ncbi:MAG: ABC transporter substrate-binding protein [Caldilineaceae bacterium]
MIRRILFLAVVLTLLNACLSSGTPPASQTPSQSSAAAAGGDRQTHYPVTISDCGGRETTYDKAPERVVTIDPSVTEMLLTLGLKDKIVGYTEFFTPDRQWAATKADMATLKMINDGANYPSKEAIVSVKPDLITSVYSYAFMDPLPDHAGWGALNIHSYQALGSCSTGGLPTDFSVLYQDMRNFGILFNVQDRAEAEIAKLQTRVAEIQKMAQSAGLAAMRIAPYDGYDQMPTYYGGLENAVISLAGSTYIWANNDPAMQTSWEQFVAADPQVIWLVPDAGVDVAELKHRLETNAKLASVTGIKNKAYVIVPQADATIESPRLVDGLEQVINGLIALQGTAVGAKHSVILESCGRKLTFAKAPERVMVTYQNVAETLVTLGLASKIAAVSFGQSAEPPANIASEVNQLKYLNERGKGMVSKEIALREQPDLVIIAYPSWDLDSAQGFATRADYELSGAQVYELGSNCVGQEGSATLETVYTDILNFGDIFGAEERAQATVQAMEQQISDVQAKIAGKPPVRVAIYDAGEGPLGFYSGGLYADMVRLAGGVNVFADLPESYSEISAEEIASSNVELFIIDDYPGAKPAAERAEYLFKTFPNLPASQNKRWVAVQDIQFAPGIRNATAVLDMAKAMYPEAVADTTNAVTAVPQRSVD